MADLERQVHSYVTGVLDGVEPISVSEINGSKPGRSSPRMRMRMRVLVAAVAVVVLVAGATLWRTVGDEGPAVVVTGSSASRSLPTRWSRLDGLGAAGPIQAMVSAPQGLVAVGAGIWFSRDARTWSLVLDPSLVGAFNTGGQLGSVNAVTVGGPGFVAAGQAVDPTSGQAVAAIWTSPDGQHWTRVTDPSLEPPTPAIPAGNSTPWRGAIHAIAAGGSGLIAVGGVFAGTFVGTQLATPAYAPAIWTSPDATHWTRVDTAKALGDGPSTISLNRIVVRRRSITVVGPNGSSTTVLQSADGVTSWRRVAVVAGRFEDMIVYRDQLVAAGSEGGPYGTPQRAVIWTSSNGQHWRQRFVSASAHLTTHTGLATHGRAIVAVGYRGRYEVLVDATVVASSDARTWKTVDRAFPPRTYLNVISNYTSQFVAFGAETTSGDGSATSPFRSRTDLFLSN